MLIRASFGFGAGQYHSDTDQLGARTPGMYGSASLTWPCVATLSSLAVLAVPAEAALDVLVGHYTG